MLSFVAGGLPLLLETALGYRILALLGAGMLSFFPLRMAWIDLGRMYHREMDRSGLWKTIRGMLLGIGAFAILVGWAYLNLVRKN